MPTGEPPLIYDRASESGDPALYSRIRYAVHDTYCHRKADCPDRAACVVRWTRLLTGLDVVVNHLRQSPRDAMGARLILHDRVCASGCMGDQRNDHATRTQSATIAAIRKALAA